MTKLDIYVFVLIRKDNIVILLMMVLVHQHRILVKLHSCLIIIANILLMVLNVILIDFRQLEVNLVNLSQICLRYHK